MILYVCKSYSKSVKIGCSTVLTAALLTIGGCSNNVEVDCGGTPTISAVEEMLQKSLEESVRNQLDTEGSIGGYDSAKLRVGTKQIKVTLNDVRTIKNDPDSSRKFCSARLLLALPDNVVEAADSTRSLANLGDVKKLAHENRVDRDGKKYGRELEYSIQPTDDGKKIIAETDEDSSLFTFMTELFSSYLLSEEVRNRAIETDKAAAADANEERREKNEAESALKEQAAANLNEAKVENKLAVERINAVWAGIPKDFRTQILGLQRAWIRKTAAQCSVEASGTSELASEREATRLRCETRAQWERAKQLERFVSYEDDSISNSAAEAGAAAAAAGEAAAAAEEAAAQLAERAAQSAE